LPEHARFAEKLMLHAQTEEACSLSRRILVGEYLKVKLGELNNHCRYGKTQHCWRTILTMPGKTYRRLAEDHERLDALLERAIRIRT
jgi:hypothetical protein